LGQLLHVLAILAHNSLQPQYALQILAGFFDLHAIQIDLQGSFGIDVGGGSHRFLHSFLPVALQVHFYLSFIVHPAKNLGFPWSDIQLHLPIPPALLIGKGWIIRYASATDESVSYSPLHYCPAYAA
jgi:hypothetical protein